MGAGSMIVPLTGETVDDLGPGVLQHASEQHLTRRVEPNWTGLSSWHKFNVGSRAVTHLPSVGD